MNRYVFFQKAAILIILATLTSAQPATSSPEYNVYRLVCCTYVHVLPVAQAIAALMIVYGGAKYAYNADDPSGKKQGKNIATSGIIGLLLLIFTVPVVSLAVGNQIKCTDVTCPGIEESGEPGTGPGHPATTITTTTTTTFTTTTTLPHCLDACLTFSQDQMSYVDMSWPLGLGPFYYCCPGSIIGDVGFNDCNEDPDTYVNPNTGVRYYCCENGGVGIAPFDCWGV